MDAGVEATRERLPDARSKSPAPTHGLAAHGWAASAKRGGLLFYSGLPALRPSGRLRRSRRSCGAVVTFLLATQEKSNSGAEGARKPLLFTQTLKQIGRASCRERV